MGGACRRAAPATSLAPTWPPSSARPTGCAALTDALLRSCCAVLCRAVVLCCAALPCLFPAPPAERALCWRLLQAAAAAAARAFAGDAERALIALCAPAVLCCAMPQVDLIARAHQLVMEGYKVGAVTSSV